MKRVLTVVCAISFVGFNISALGQANISDEMQGIVVQADNAEENILSLVNQLYDKLNKAIKTIDDISHKTRKKINDGQYLSQNDTREFIKQAKFIYNTFNDINQDRYLYKRGLKGDDGGITVAVQKANSLLSERQDMLQEKTMRRAQLNKNYANLSNLEKKETEALDAQISILSGTVDLLARFQGEISRVERNYLKVEKDVDEFFMMINLNTGTAQILLEHLQISNEIEG
ncbi:MAG: hypothetical protein KDD15_10960, partial [Lewinella sp.]|nr:hypothetical protein [Lewinella sp.]